MPHRRSLRGRAGLVVADQGVSSLGNVALTLVVAHSVPLVGFGRYALVLAAYQILATMAQALVGEPLLVLSGRISSAAVGGAVATSLTLGALAGLAIALACVILPSAPLLALAVLLPGLLLQDCLRHVAFSRNRAHLALASDTVWTVTQLVATVAVIRSGHTNVRDLVLAWGAPAWLAAVVLAVPLATVPRFREIPTWTHVSRRLTRRYIGEAAASVGTVQVTLYLTGALAGPAAAGQLRLVQALFGPLHVVATGMRAFGVPEVARRIAEQRDSRSVVRTCALLLGGLATLWTAALGFAPAGLGAMLAGPAWPMLAGVIWTLGAQKVLESLGTAPFIVHRARQRATWTLVVRLLSTVVTLTTVSMLVGRMGADGAAVGMLAGSALAVTCWWAGYLTDRGEVPAVAGRDRPSCHVISHSYLEPEVAKNLRALGEHLRVTLVTPRSGSVLVFPQRAAGGSGARTGYHALSFRRLPRRGPIYLLASLRLGMARRPDHVVIEYDPWMPIFWQGLLAAKLFAGAQVHLAVKKNTFRATPPRVAAVKRLLARVGLRYVAGVMSTSHMTARLYEREFGYPANRITVVPHLAVDTVVFRPTITPCPVDRFRIGFVGRVNRRKGVDTLLRSFALVREQIPQAELHLMGPVDPDLGDEIARLRLRGGLRVHPTRANDRVAEFLRTVDAFVMPSAREPDHEEHDGRALLEAMATGLPCVGSDSGIIPELLFPDNGVVFTAGDHIGLAEELFRLAKDPELRGSLGRNARGYLLATASLAAVASARARVLTTGRRGRGVSR
ncbi:MAG TPA: glycosyltransferase [Mycobacteriales bacterium]